MKRYVSIVICVLLIVQLILLLPADASDGLPYRMITGTTDAFGGGDYVLFDLNETMTFGVVHGGSGKKAPITIFSRGLDVTGLVETENGTRPLTASTFTVFRLGSILEFNDTDRDGRFDRATGDSAVRSVNLSLDWTRTRVLSREGPRRGMYQWHFSLVASNLGYSYPGRNATVTAAEEVLELVKFDLIITLQPERRSLVLRTRGEEDAKREKVDLVGARMKWKMDHRVFGWDTSSGNENPAIMLGFDLTLARSYSSRAALGADILSTVGDRDTIVSIPVSGSSRSVWDMASNSLMPLERRGLDEGNITIGGENWASRMFWNSGLQRLPATEAGRARARLFLYGYDVIGPSSEIWNSRLIGSKTGLGVRISGGYTYPAMMMIVHDPGVETLGFSPPDVEKRPGDGGGTGIVGFVKENTEISVVLFFIIVLAAVGTAAILTLSRRVNMYHDQELKSQQEQEIFHVVKREKDWDSLKVKKSGS